MDYNEFFERFEIDYTQSLDKAGLGTVYLGNDILNGINCAIKIIEIHKSFDKSLPSKHFHKAAELSSPNLMTYLGICRIESEETVQYFLAMNYFPLGNLTEQLAKTNLTEKFALIIKITDALAYLHENGIVWQQLRAEHILLDKTDSLYQPVFINYAQSEFLPKLYFHNYEYLSPEQIHGEQENLDSKTDIWSLGVLIYYIFTNVLPFGKKSTLLPNKKIAERITQESLDLPENIPSVFRNIIQKCLAKEKENRWNNVNEIKEFLSTVLPEDLNSIKKQAGIIETLEKMGEDFVVDEKETKIIPILQRRVRRKPAKPVTYWEPALWIIFALLFGYLLAYFLK
jgi:serine/threonine protein kinase